MRPYIVVLSCGRSGTKYTSKVFKQLGLDVGHECMGKDGMIAGGLAAGADQPKSPFCLHWWHDLPKRRVILHQVREPLAAISSLQTVTETSWRYITAVDWRIHQKPLLSWCMSYWLYWNLRIEQYMALRYQVEVAHEILPRIVQCLIYPQPLPDIAIDIPTNINTRQGHYSPVTWSQLFSVNPELAQRVRELAREYCYLPGGVP